MNKPKMELIPVEKIDDAGRARKNFGNLDELKNSILTHGLIHPITILKQGDNYKLLAGGRRLAAIRELGWKQTPAVVYDGELNDMEQKAIELQENLQRKAFDWQEEVLLKKEIHETHMKLYGKKASPSDTRGWSLRETAKLLGMDAGQLSKEIRLASMLSAMPELKEKKSKTEAIKLMNKTLDDAQAVAMINLVEKEKQKSKEQGTDSPAFVKNMKRYQDAYIIGDTMEKLKELPDDYFDIVDLDPPYGIDLKNMKRSETEELQLYNEVDASTYPQFIEDVLLLVKDKMKRSGSWLLLWYAMEPWQDVVFKAARKLQFKGHRIPLIWVKPQGQTNAPHLYLGSAYETAYYLRRGKAEIKRKGTNNVFQYQKDNEHPAGKPIALMRDILSVFGERGARVLVPFAGSGSTLVAAFELGMHPVGIDLSEDYKVIYTKLLAKSGVIL